jgi:hypothetical protein
VIVVGRGSASSLERAALVVRVTDRRQDVAIHARTSQTRPTCWRSMGCERVDTRARRGRPVRPGNVSSPAAPPTPAVNPRAIHARLRLQKCRCWDSAASSLRPFPGPRGCCSRSRRAYRGTTSTGMIASRVPVGPASYGTLMRRRPGLSLLLTSARRQAVRDGPERAGTPSDGRSCRQAICAVHTL